MVKTNDLNDYTFINVLRNICSWHIDTDGCEYCPLAKICDGASGIKTIQSIRLEYDPNMEVPEERETENDG